MLGDQIVRDIHKVTTADNEPVALHTTSRATPKDLLISLQWSEVCKEADELTIVCSKVVMDDADITQVKQDFSDLITSASENVSSVTISSVLPDTTGARDERIKEINNFLKDKSRDTGARFVDNDQNFLFRDGSCDTSAFQKRLMSNLSRAAGNHREDGAQRDLLRRGTAICQDRPTSNRPPKQRRSGPASRPSSQGAQYSETDWQKAAENGPQLSG